MLLKPLHDRVAVERIVEEAKSSGGILLTGSAVEKPDTAMVVAVGHKVREVLVGDKVLLGRFAGQSVVHEGRDLLLICEADIVAILEA